VTNGFDLCPFGSFRDFETMVAEQKKIHASPPRSCLVHPVCRTLFILYSLSCLSACSDDHRPAATYFIELIHDKPLFIEALLIPFRKVFLMLGEHPIGCAANVLRR
jgi:hypothetical protein